MRKREKTLLCQEDGKQSNEYFEDATISLLQQLASITSNEADSVRRRPKSRWRARTRCEAEGSYEKGELKAGLGYGGTNASLRQDLHDISEVEAGMFTSGTKVKQTKAAITGDDLGGHKPDPKIIGRMTAGENDTASGPVSRPSRNRRQRQRRNYLDPGVPLSEAMFIIRTAWKPPAASVLFDIFPKHSYDPAHPHLVDPFRDHRDHLLAVFKLALVTRDRVEEAKTALADVFVGLDEFNENAAIDTVRKLAGRFEEEGWRKVQPSERRRAGETIGTDSGAVTPGLKDLQKG